MDQVIPPAASPVFPATWTPQVAQAARDHTAQAYPNEAAGIVQGGEYHRLENTSMTPDRDVVLTDADLLRVADADIFFHSHPDGIGCPSAQDMIYQQQLGIPFAVLTWPLPDLFFFGDQCARQPLIGRAFRHGVHDCYSLCRDFFAERHGVDLIDPPRGWNWWVKGESLYLDNFQRAGFQRIPIEEATQVGDGLLFCFNYDVPMHAALVWDRDLLLHHASGVRPVDRTRLSGLVPRVRYQRHATHALRWVS